DFRLNDSGPFPGGVGRETRIPVELSVGYAAGKQIMLEAGLGYSFAQNLELLDASGNTLADQDLNGALMLRFEFGYRFLAALASRSRLRRSRASILGGTAIRFPATFSGTCAQRASPISTSIHGIDTGGWNRLNIAITRRCR